MIQMQVASTHLGRWAWSKRGERQPRTSKRDGRQEARLRTFRLVNSEVRRRPRPSRGSTGKLKHWQVASCTGSRVRQTEFVLLALAFLNSPAALQNNLMGEEEMDWIRPEMFGRRVFIVSHLGQPTCTSCSSLASSLTSESLPRHVWRLAR